MSDQGVPVAAEYSLSASVMSISARSHTLMSPRKFSGRVDSLRMKVISRKPYTVRIMSSTFATWLE